jgi:SAM-dependent methyltransferase
MNCGHDTGAISHVRQSCREGIPLINRKDDDPLKVSPTGLFKDVPHPRVLEIGCSTGWRLARLKEDGASVCGVDINPVALAEGQAAGLDLREGRAQSLPALPHETFDVVILGYVLTSIVDAELRQVLDEALRVTAHGGWLIIYDAPKLSLPSRPDMPCPDVPGSWNWLLRRSLTELQTSIIARRTLPDTAAEAWTLQRH